MDEPVARTASILLGLAAVISIAAGPARAEGGSDKTTPKKTVCTMIYQPVCAEKNGARKTYSNACFAVVDGAKKVADGPCK